MCKLYGIFYVDLNLNGFDQLVELFNLYRFKLSIVDFIDFFFFVYGFKDQLYFVEEFGYYGLVELFGMVYIVNINLYDDMFNVVLMKVVFCWLVMVFLFMIIYLVGLIIWLVVS